MQLKWRRSSLVARAGSRPAQPEAAGPARFGIRQHPSDIFTASGLNVVVGQRASLGRRSPKVMKTRLAHLTMEQWPPAPFSRAQSAEASALDRPTTRSLYTVSPLTSAVCRPIVDPLSAAAYLPLSRLRSRLASASDLGAASWPSRSGPWGSDQQPVVWAGPAQKSCPRRHAAGDLGTAWRPRRAPPERQRTRIWVAGLWPRQPPWVLSGSRLEAAGSACPPSR